MWENDQVSIFPSFLLTYAFQKSDDLWDYLDKNGTSFLEYDEFLRGFLGEMSERRKLLVRKVRDHELI